VILRAVKVPNAAAPFWNDVIRRCWCSHDQHVLL